LNLSPFVVDHCAVNSYFVFRRVNALFLPPTRGRRPRPRDEAASSARARRKKARTSKYQKDTSVQLGRDFQVSLQGNRLAFTYVIREFREGKDHDGSRHRGPGRNNPSWVRTGML
jgi:hypothetical protein